MHARLAMSILLASLTACSRAETDAATPGTRFNPPMSYFDSIIVEQTTLAGLNYAWAYEAATVNDTAGLSVLLLATLHTDGVGAGEHAQILWTLLKNWGDSAFAAVLARSRTEVHQKVRCFLDYTAPESWPDSFPLTAALWPLDKTCRGG
jgi:hypothetical protein